MVAMTQSKQKAESRKQKAESALSYGNADLVSFGTAFLVNLNLVDRFKQGEQLNKADPATFYQGEERGYTDYPLMTESRKTL